MTKFEPIRLGMIGGGQGAFIGAVHRIAARIDGQFNLVAGALSSNAERALASALELGIDAERSYASYEDMAVAEAARADGIEVVAIVTPNHMHAGPAIAFLKAGIHVICDKPLTSTIEEARLLEAVAKASGKLFILTHNYTGYPMIRQAKDMVANGTLGEVRMIQAEYAQEWLTEPADADNKQAAWRTDPKRSGVGGCVGDIGTHAYNLTRFVTGLELDSLSADIDAFVDGRPLDDNINVMLRFKGGAKGMLWSSQIAVGNENGLSLRVYGTKGGIEWAQENPNILYYTPFGQPKQIITRGGVGASESANAVSRTPGGHPEGYLEGFATIYNGAAKSIRLARGGELNTGMLPTIEDGVEGMQFIMAVVNSSAQNAKWLRLEDQG
ncbi:MAG: Gfo/Idh/MocA family oxidoreductase [Rhizobiales bacterium]|nr:Gfo/Idh/MocA family oxidoreductase [Hyphomicrobiales bacterium]NRB14466.1 Gfo/Idh/MocA family oxidoreductase [Hyphomicrobiales bacterium]